ncbi:MAG: SAM-dependent methyltransferase [Nannocystaceae bacterium]
MHITKAARARLRRALRRNLAEGWQRAVFAAPLGGREDADEPADERIVAGPASADVEVVAAALADLEATALEEARAGRVKQTFVIDARRSVVIDARHGKARVRELDDAAIHKRMGGKDRLLRPDRSAELLRVIGIMNADGTISTKRARKYKQVNHLIELCRPTWEHLKSHQAIGEGRPLRVLDLACGNATLSFLLAEALRLEGLPLRLHGVDVREPLIARARARAEALELPQLSFAVGTIAAAARSVVDVLGGPPDLVLALHACDTATDEALDLAIRAGAGAILAAPCCQRELAAQLEGADLRVPTPAIARHGLLRRAHGEVLTDALRVEALAACGYDTTTLEFVASEHTAKNLLIRALRRRPGQPVERERWRLGPLLERRRALAVRPTLLALLERDGSDMGAPGDDPG